MDYAFISCDDFIDEVYKYVDDIDAYLVRMDIGSPSSQILTQTGEGVICLFVLLMYSVLIGISGIVKLAFDLAYALAIVTAYVVSFIIVLISISIKSFNHIYGINHNE